ncbi:MAG: inorganic pyrophosphatase [Candidatus Bathyarchaeota archaeon]|nr:inorganic pyrophosphatase [Candidatus Bathyarchaeota archaeon]
MVDGRFWVNLDRLVAESRVIVDNPRGTHDGDSSTFVYPVDYGYLEGTSSMDGEGIDVFVGSDPGQMVDAIVCTVDLVKRDSEIKVLIGCTEEEKQAIMGLYEVFPPMCGVLVRRG